jgi:NAD+ kinase
VTRVGFILKPDKSEAGALVSELVPYLRDRGHVPVVTTEDQIAPPGAEVIPEDELGESCEFVVVLGGDGTILRAARLVSEHKRPVLGVNLGQLGFLTPFSIGDVRAAIDLAVAGKLGTERRMRIAVKFVRDGAAPVIRYALNDAVLHQGAMARLVEIEASVDGFHVAQYRADGLIVATPTGSTAYNMAAGGPIMVPGIDAMTITPICAHALTHRPLVIGGAATIKLVVGADVRGVILTVDGQWGHSFVPGDAVEMTAARTPLVIYTAGQSFFDVMRDKLHWGVRGTR